MTIQAMERLTGQMVVSDKFRNGMLVPDPSAKTETLQTFQYFSELDAEEVAAILSTSITPMFQIQFSRVGDTKGLFQRS